MTDHVNTAEEDAVPASVGDLGSIHEAMRDVAVGMQAIALSISEDTRRKRRFGNRMLVLIVGMLLVMGTFQFYRAQESKDNQQQLKDFVAQVSEQNRADIQAAIDQLVKTSDPERVTKQDVVELVCDLDPTLCDAEGRYVGR